MQKNSSTEEKRLVSIIIPCRNEKDHITKCLQSLLQNDYESKEILVIDGLSRDGTRDIVNEFAEDYTAVKLIDNPDKYTPLGMNIGIRNARGDYLMIAGAHTIFPKEYISTLVGYLQNLADASVTGAPLKTTVDDTRLGNSIARVLSDKLGVGNSTFRTGTDTPLTVDTVPYGIYEKEVFEEIGYYDERLIRNQDIELSRRILKSGGKIYLIPDVSCEYYIKGSLKFLAKSSYKNGLWNILTLYITKNIRSISLRHFIPLIFILSLVVPVILAWVVNSAFIYISLLILVIYFSVITVNSLILNDRKTKYIYILWSHIVLHFSYGVGSLTGLFHLHKLFK